MRLGFIGSDGIPARHGGFETFVEQVVPRLLTLGHEVVVVGSGKRRRGPPPVAAGLTIINLPMSANGVASIFFDLWSAWTVRSRVDALIVLGVSGGIFFPIIRLLAGGRPLLCNVDGLESHRAKWAGAKSKFLALSEAIAVHHADAIISDNQGIAALVTQNYNRSSTVIAYGSDHVRHPPADLANAALVTYGLAPQDYALTIARIEPENNIVMMIDAFLATDISRYAVVGNFAATPHGRSLLARFGENPRLELIQSLYDPDVVGALRSACRVYLHGHSVGGTNPSLVEILPYGRPILAFDCVFNRNTLRQSGGYFTDEKSLVNMLAGPLDGYVPPEAVRDDPAYIWATIAQQYADLAASI